MFRDQILDLDAIKRWMTDNPQLLAEPAETGLLQVCTQHL